MKKLMNFASNFTDR